MRPKQLESVSGTIGTIVTLVVVAVTAGLGPTGWLVGLAVGWGVTGLLAIARRRRSCTAFSPADRVTLTRGVLTSGAAALVADSFTRPTSTTALVVLAAAAMALDAVDGQVARRTDTVTAFGARFDAEVDALLILVLSVSVSRDYGTWVLAIGAARYAFLLAGLALPWLAAPLPQRFWGKVVAVVQGVVLTAALSGLLPALLGMITVAVALVLLTLSFGYDTVNLYRSGAGPRTHAVVRRSSAVLAATIVWAVLVAPDRFDQLTPAAFARIPLEGIALVVLGLFLPRRPRRMLAGAAGFAIGLITVVKLLDATFEAQLDRPFNLVSDWTNLMLGIGVVRDSVGTRITDELLVLAGVGLLVLVSVVTASAVRLSEVTAEHRGYSVRGLTVLGAVWALSATMSLQVAPGTSIASLATARLAVAQVRDAETALRDQQIFETTLHSADPYAQIASSDLLAGLRGKDVLLVFVESYGQVAVQGTSFSTSVDRALTNDAAELARAGFSARSGLLTSPTFGGVSWIAHATLQSGLWIDDQDRYDQLMNSDRLTLSSAFGKAGWRTVSDNPADKRIWADGRSFYHYDKLYGRDNVGYRGPRFSWASMPDQYTLSAFQHRELHPGHAPVMAELDLVSSHTPWTPLPHMVPWSRLGNGSIFDPMPAEGLSPGAAWQDSATVRRLYGQSIEYSIGALTSWITRLHDKNLVVILLGDHQPATTVSGYDATHNVPISIVARNSSVIDAVGSWHWQPGLVPGAGSPVWSMDSFRNIFLRTFSSAPATLALRRPR